MTERNGTADLGLRGRVALITGGTRGVGLAVARRLCAAGCPVVLGYRADHAAAERAVKSLTGLPGAVDAVAGDVSRPAGVATLLDAVRSRHGGLDIFVHNAAHFTPMPATRLAASGVRADLATALTPLAAGAAGVAELMAGRPGRIIAVSSNGARDAVPAYASLGMAKAALESLVRYLAVELAPQGITVNAVSTSKIDKGPDTPAPDVAAVLAGRTPAGRLTTAQDVAGVVALLCTDEAAWLQGQVITADGGLGLRG